MNRKNRIKHYYATIQEQNGEQEYLHCYLFKTSECPDKYNDNTARTWRGDENNEYDKDSKGYWVDDCIIMAKTTRQIPENHFKILRKYLAVL